MPDIDYDRCYCDVLDIIDTSRTRRKDSKCYKMHKSTNEKLSNIFGLYDFQDKEVLSVLSSSDQMLSSYYLGARNVDTFDNNLTTYLFYYLKKWCMEYTGKSYLSASNRELIECLDLHGDNEVEKNVAMFWKRILCLIRVPLADSPLFYKNFHDYNVPYSDDVPTISGIIKEVDPHYQELDLFTEQDTSKQYDIIVLSNILEYAYEEDDIKIYETIMNNLLNALKDDGIVICSSLIFDRTMESGIFSEFFEKQPGAYEYEEYRNKTKSISYSYTKKIKH